MTVWGTVFANIDLSKIKGLERIKHLGPSEIGLTSIVRSEGGIPEIFLRGTGVSDSLITYIKSLTTKPIEFYSCFISYSHKDDEFTKCLYQRLREKKIRVWYAPQTMQAGQKIYEQIDSAIRISDKLIVILSENSMHSEWVSTEISRAREREIREGRRILFPIRLVDFEAILNWQVYAEIGRAHV